MTPPPRALAWNDLAEGMAERLPVSFDAADMDAFARLSGDFNPLHTDAAFARGRGFPGRVVYGGLIVARVSRLLGMLLPGRDGMWASLRMDFRAPLMMDEAAELAATVTHLSEAARLVRLKLVVTAGARLIASGTAESVLRDG